MVDKRQKLTYAQVKSVDGLSSRDAAKKLGVGKTTINDARDRVRRGTFFDPEEEYARKPKILTYDIESSPHLGWFWGAWQQNIAPIQMEKPGRMICFASKWLGSDEITFYSEYHNTYREMVEALWQQLSEADIVVGYNNDRYDDRRVNNEFARLELGPPKPYKSVDIIKLNKANFDFPYRKLDWLATEVGTAGNKNDTGGFQLWLDCMDGDPKAWETMKEYNIQDVIVTEDSYLQLLPWQKNSVHIGLFTQDEDACWACGSKDLEPAGYLAAGVQSYEAFRCGNCKAWNRGTTAVGVKLRTRRAIR
jgi:hypothetical protein